MSQEIVAVVGPTASGKTELAVALARELGAEVVSADSRQVYRGLDAGTAKPRLDASGRLDGISYHLIDVCEVRERFDAGRYARLAAAAIDSIRARGKRPIVAGGTGLYLRALLEGLSPLPSASPALRAELESAASRLGRHGLHARLASADPAAASRIPAGNLQRVIRALEVYELTGRPISSFWSARPRPSAQVVAIDWPVEALKERIARRAEEMWPAMVEEAARLLAAGLTGHEPGLESIGYPQALACARGALPREQGLSELIRLTSAYAKRQRTWFRGQAPEAARISGGATGEMLSSALRILAGDLRPPTSYEAALSR